MSAARKYSFGKRRSRFSSSADIYLRPTCSSKSAIDFGTEWGVCLSHLNQKLSEETSVFEGLVGMEFNEFDVRCVLKQAGLCPEFPLEVAHGFRSAGGR